MLIRAGWGTLFVVLAFGSLSAVWWGLDGLFDDAGRANDLAGILQAVVTAAAVLVGGVYAAYKLQVFRDFEPHLSISHSLSHRPVGESYVHVSVTAVLQNSSRVKISLREAFFRIQQIAPATDEEVGRLYAQVFEDQSEEEIQWPTLARFLRTWKENDGIVEPGDSYTEFCEFVIDRDVESVVVYSYFYNPAFVKGRGASEGWGATTVYNID